MENLLLIEKVSCLVQELKSNKNDSFLFFEDILNKLESNIMKNETINTLRTCYSITQYANFTYTQEKLLEDILEMID